MNTIEALHLLKEGKKVRRKSWDKNFYLQIGWNGRIFSCRNEDDYNTFIPYVDMLIGDDWEVYGELILDKVEKRYLENVLRPFKDKVRYIKKVGKPISSIERLRIGFKIDNEMPFPTFEEGTMYKGMELDREYSLKELGLFE